jgi:hypothetical protein
MTKIIREILILQKYLLQPESLKRNQKAIQYFINKLQAIYFVGDFTTTYNIKKSMGIKLMLMFFIGMLIASALPLIPFGGAGAEPSTRENLPPSVEITHPANEATVKGIINVSGTASDDVKVTQVQVIILEKHYNATDTSGNGSWYTWNYTFNTTKYEDGWLHIGALAKDGTLASDTSIKVLIKNTPPDEEKPKIWIATPGNNTEVSGTIAIRGHATDNREVVSVDLVIAEKEYEAVDTSGNHTWYKWVLEFDTTTLDNGEYWVTARAWDGKNTEKDRIVIIINNSEPKENHWPYVEITHPSNEATVSGIITISGKAWDIDGNITSVKVIIAEVHYEANDTSGNGSWYYWSLKFNTSILEDGERRVVAISKDDGGKLGDHGIWIIIKNTKENHAPYVEITHPKNEATVSGVILIKGKAWDVDGKVVKVKVRIFEVWYDAKDTSGNGSWYTWQLEFNTTKLKDGEYKVTAVAYDDKEKLEDAGIWIIIKNHKENLAPHVEITHPKNEATVSGVILIKGKAWDADGKVVKVKVRIFEVWYDAKDTSGNSSWYTWQLEFNTTKLKNGEYKVTALAYDDKEKLEDAGIWIIVKNIIDEKPNKAPYVFITQPKHHAKVKGVIVIKGTAWDVDGKVSKVKVRIYEKWYEAKDTSGNNTWYYWALEFNTSNFENGWYRVTAAAYDGHAWGDDYIYIYFNNTKIRNKCPELKINHPKAHSEVSGMVVISGNAWDDRLVKHVKVRIGENKYLAKDTSGNDTWYTWKYVWNTSGYENGEYKITAIVYDGICTEDAHIVVKLNNTSKESSPGPDSSESEDHSKSKDKDEESPAFLPGFEGPMFLVAAAIAAVVVSFFRSDRGGGRTR